jgi:hypothetical protein
MRDIGPDQSTNSLIGNDALQYRRFPKREPLDARRGARILACRSLTGRENAVEAHETHEVGETIAESTHKPHGEDRFRRLAAVFLGVLGMLLAIASLGGEDAMKQTINANILASDTYAFYQARNIRQTSYQLAAETLEAILASRPDLPAEARQPIADHIAEYRATAKRYESDAAAGNGKKELLAKARTYEAERDVSQERDINFDYGRALFQIALVLGSVSIVAASRPLLWLSGALALVAALLSINGFLLLVELPFG